VRADLAVTGEITLRGHILPVGGLKEKLLAARRERFMALALPYENRAEITALPKEVTAGLKLYYIREFRELAALALTGRGEETDGEESDNSTPLSGRCLWKKAAEREEGEGEEEGN
jgi:endopeptidase La